MKSFGLFVFTAFFLFACSEKRVKNNNLKIACMYFHGTDSSGFQKLKSQIEKFYRCKVELYPSMDLPHSSFVKTKNKYRADSLLKQLASKDLESNEILVGLTREDICIRKNGNPDWGVFGYGQCPGVASVVSYHRLKKDHPSATVLS